MINITIIQPIRSNISLRNQSFPVVEKSEFFETKNRDIETSRLETKNREFIRAVNPNRLYYFEIGLKKQNFTDVKKVEPNEQIIEKKHEVQTIIKAEDVNIICEYQTSKNCDCSCQINLRKKEPSPEASNRDLSDPDPNDGEQGMDPLPKPKNLDGTSDFSVAPDMNTSIMKEMGKIGSVKGPAAQRIARDSLDKLLTSIEHQMNGAVDDLHNFGVGGNFKTKIPPTLSGPDSPANSVATNLVNALIPAAGPGIDSDLPSLNVDPKLEEQYPNNQEFNG